MATRKIHELTDPNAVSRAISECDAIGQDAFNKKYGFAGARRYRLAFDGAEYDAKSILLAAYAFQFPNADRLTRKEFAGSRPEVYETLRRLGFTVIDSFEDSVKRRNTRQGITALTDRNAVIEAIRTFDRLGREKFLEDIGFGPSTNYFISYGGQFYDSKPIAGLAFGIQHLNGEPLPHARFSGGEKSVKPLLERLGFQIVSRRAGTKPQFTSKLAVANTDSDWYSFFRPDGQFTHHSVVNFWRPQAQSQFKALEPGSPFFFRLKHPVNSIAGFGVFDRFESISIADAWSIYGHANGVATLEDFIARVRNYQTDEAQILSRPLGCIVLRDAIFAPNSDWIGWTESENWARNIVAFKTYPGDQLPGLRLIHAAREWSGRPLVSDVVSEALLSDNKPTVDPISHEVLTKETAELFSTLDAPPQLTEDVNVTSRLVNRKARSVVFRAVVRLAYSNRCAVCGLGVYSPAGEHEVQAAHIFPRHLNGTDDPRNGIALCQHHHWCFDHGLIGISDDLTVVVSHQVPRSIEFETIWSLEGRSISLPTQPELRPHQIFLKAHRQQQGLD